MGRYIEHAGKRRKIGRQELQVMAMLLCVELAVFLYAYIRDVAGMYCHIAAVLIPASVIFCFFGFYFKANANIIIWTVLLMNLGFLAQLMSMSYSSSTPLKCAFAFAAALAAAFCYRYFMQILSMDKGILVLMLVQFMLCVLLLLFGKSVGKVSEQGARINLIIGGIAVQPLEVVKVLYIFVTAGLLCKNERSDRKILKIPRELFFMIYTVMLGIWMFGFSELGTFLVMFLSGLLMFCIYSYHRKVVGVSAVGAGAVVLAGWGLCLLLKNRGGVFLKLYNRVMYAYHPELDATGAGMQGIQIRKALTVGEAFGPDSKRYITGFFGQESDLVFAKMIQTCGFVMGLFVLISMLLLLQESYKIIQKQKDCYFRGLATGITVLIMVEAVVHIAVNVGLMPITGIPLYFCSQGITSLTTGLMMIAVMLVLSIDEYERSRYFEENIDRRFGIFKGRRRSHPKRK